MPEYDPLTCITAAELRELGFEIPADVPDPAWVPRLSMRIAKCEFEDEPENVRQGILAGNFSIEFTEPFRWIDIDVEVSIQ